ncbi:8365_t:CDS:2 [Cetraspora pellucida]|uniref:8365_t:CDS:1 n=1 Tax=Cetraspora pellucida TaxID=1433469 RepID=A0ACA9KWE5_9GLOM|nr:8365_t:CDS:2 [Cetraspora pellucida]
MTSMQFTINSLKKLNLKLIFQINKLRKKNVKVKTENTRLKQVIKENAMLKIRFKELEKKNKTDTAKLTVENVELKDASSIKNILQSTACSKLSINT